MNILFLDDCPRRTKKFRSRWPFATIVHTSDDAISQLASDTVWDYVFLDHDLGGEVYVNSSREDCGMAVVRWIIEHKPQASTIIVHSLNAPAREHMVGDLKNAGFVAHSVPYINLYDSDIANILG